MASTLITLSLLVENLDPDFVVAHTGEQADAYEERWQAKLDGAICPSEIDLGPDLGVWQIPSTRLVLDGQTVAINLQLCDRDNSYVDTITGVVSDPSPFDEATADDVRTYLTGLGFAALNEQPRGGVPSAQLSPNPPPPDASTTAPAPAAAPPATPPSADGSAGTSTPATPTPPATPPPAPTDNSSSATAPTPAPAPAASPSAPAASAALTPDATTAVQAPSAAPTTPVSTTPADSSAAVTDSSSAPAQAMGDPTPAGGRKPGKGSRSF